MSLSLQRYSWILMGTLAVVGSFVSCNGPNDPAYNFTRTELAGAAGRVTEEPIGAGTAGRTSASNGGGPAIAGSAGKTGIAGSAGTSTNTAGAAGKDTTSHAGAAGKGGASSTAGSAGRAGASGGVAGA